jgi:alkyl hydroperoxide reductase subunit AhpC
MANARWKLDRDRRAAMAAKDPAFTGLQIVRRIIVIDREQRVREAVIYAGDSARSARAKLKRILSQA